MNRLKTRGHIIDHQILDNESSKKYRRHVTDIWAATYKLVPPQRLSPQHSRTCHLHLQGSLPQYPRRHPSILPKLLVVQTPPADQTIPQPYPLVHHRSPPLCLGSLQRPLQLRLHPPWPHRLPIFHPQQAINLRLLGLPRARRILCRPRPTTLPLLPSSRYNY